jgi:hypothetical protein
MPEVSYLTPIHEDENDDEDELGKNTLTQMSIPEIPPKLSWRL